MIIKNKIMAPAVKIPNRPQKPSSEIEKKESIKNPITKASKNLRNKNNPKTAKITVPHQDNKNNPPKSTTSKRIRLIII